MNKRPGWWTSKLGDAVDIEHVNPWVIENRTYGTFRFAMKIPFRGKFPDLGQLYPPPAKLVSARGEPLVR
jgi:hypothetical protein